MHKTFVVCSIPIFLMVGCNHGSDEFGVATINHLAACENPAPLTGSPHPSRPDSYIVTLRDDVDVPQEAARLASLYGFVPTTVFIYVPSFAATLNPETVAALRCESTVVRIRYEQVFTPD